ncbi:MAG: hypothetical protein AAF492_22270 [Verrucomicrobiota bacterium]
MKRLACLCFALCISTSASADEVKNTWLTIGQGWAVVREVRMIELRPGEQTLSLNGIPDKADLMTLRLHSKRVRLDLLGWERQGGEPSLEEARGAIRRPAAPQPHRAQGVVS